MEDRSFLAAKATIFYVVLCWNSPIMREKVSFLRQNVLVSNVKVKNLELIPKN